MPAIVGFLLTGVVIGPAGWASSNAYDFCCAYSCAQPVRIFPKLTRDLGNLRCAIFVIGLRRRVSAKEFLQRFEKISCIL
ncbi:MAG: hypothetical protein ACREP3_02765, partial [Candidatus Binatia bacterium]